VSGAREKSEGMPRQVRRRPERAELGRVGELGAESVLAALQGVSAGRIYDLDAGRFPDMHRWAGHPPFQLTTFRTPRGEAVEGDVDDVSGENNRDGFRFVTELMVSSMHIGTHIDALCHIVRDGEGWFGGFAPDEHLGDRGPTRCDASTIPPIIVNATLLDVAGHRGVDALEGGEGIGWSELMEVAAAQNTPLRQGEAVLVRTGAMSLWPDVDRYDRHAGAGINLDAATHLLSEHDVVLVGSDTPTVEQIPTASESHPQPVHEYLLRSNGVHLLEYAYLEELAADRAYRFAFICLALKVEGATASMVRPIAIT
jgi:kynurenine formamidase